MTHQPIRAPQTDPHTHTMRGALTAALVAIALKDPDPKSREAKLAILKKDGWL